MTTGLLHALRGLHILGGAFWFGAAVMNAAFLAPTVRALGPAAGPVMRHLMAVRRLSLWINIAAWTAILSGVWLYGWRSAWFTASWMTASTGIAYGTGGVLALVAAVIGGGIIARTAKRMTGLAASLDGAEAPSPELAREMAALQGRMERAGVVVAVMLTLVALAMAVARYT